MVENPSYKMYDSRFPLPAGVWKRRAGGQGWEAEGAELCLARPASCWRSSLRTGGPWPEHHASQSLWWQEGRSHTLRGSVSGGQSRSCSPSGEAAGREKEFFSPLHRILNSFYLNGKCLQLNLDLYQLVHKTQGKKALMMEKNQTVWWPGAKFYVEKSGGQKKTSWNVEALISWKKQGLGSRQDVTSEQTPELVDAHLITNETSILRRHCWEADIWPAHSTMHSIWIKYCWLDTNFQIKGHS